jgi:AhpD family alkylhydroperoxidase
MLFNWSEHVPAVKKAFGALGKSHPKMLAAYRALEEASSADDVLDAKTRELISLAVAITTRCDGCIGVHAEAARRAGANEAEVAQALATAIALNSGAAYVYSLRALEAFEHTAA